MPDVVAALTKAGYPPTTLPVEADTFEFGLVLAGAISAGAYTAGVLDFLIEAIDSWEALKKSEIGLKGQDKTVSPHKLLLKVITGASAGAMNGAIAAVALKYKFPHVSMRSQDEGEQSRNPFYKAWVKDIDIRKLMATTDLRPGREVNSALNSDVIETITQAALDYHGTPVAITDRPYLEANTRIVFTLGNLRGAPYYLQFQGLPGAGGQVMRVHRDYRGFVLSLNDGTPKPVKTDDLGLPAFNSWDDQIWKCFGTAALGSGAFPIGLAARPLSRPYADYQNRYVMLPPDASGHTQPVLLLPMWNPAVDTTKSAYKSYVVDGGTMNNEPLDLARTELAGICGRNARNSYEAHRAIIMIDPFPDFPGEADDLQSGATDALLPSFMGLLSAWKDQSRFSAEDLALALDETVYSRFLIAPRRYVDNVPQTTAIACGVLGGFGGFLSEAYRRHDYLLGRRNCQKFLKEVFVLSATNKLFDNWENQAARQQAIDVGPPATPNAPQGFLPIIPLVENLASQEEQVPVWPVDTIDLEEIERLLEQRLNALVPRLLDDFKVTGLLERAGADIVTGVLKTKARNAILDKIQKAMLSDDCGLLTKHRTMATADPNSLKVLHDNG